MFAGFAAPEQYTNEINGTWTDVYGISAVLYRCLTGCIPTEAIARNGTSLMEPMMINRNIPANISSVIPGIVAILAPASAASILARVCVIDVFMGQITTSAAFMAAATTEGGS